MSVHKELVKIAVIGNVNAGKSSLIGVLTSGQLDDGNGKARAKVIKNPHEAFNLIGLASPGKLNCFKLPFFAF